jgi:hypothetical protein
MMAHALPAHDHEAIQPHQSAGAEGSDIGDGRVVGTAEMARPSCHVARRTAHSRHTHKITLDALLEEISVERGTSHVAATHRTFLLTSLGWRAQNLSRLEDRAAPQYFALSSDFPSLSKLIRPKASVPRRCPTRPQKRRCPMEPRCHARAPPRHESRT